MTTGLRRAAAILSLAAALTPWPARAQMALLPGSRLWLEGDSTLHAYKCEATRLEVDFAWKGPAPAAPIEEVRAGAGVALKLSVPVAGLKSDHGGLDRNLRKALAADKNPEIVFTLRSYAVERSSTGADAIAGEGELVVAGVARPQTIRAALSARDGSLVLDGEHALLMTDFGVEPPTALLGAVRAADRVVVKFHLDLGRKP